MYKKTHSVIIRLVALMLVLVLVVPANVSAAAAETVQPYASSYLRSYNSYIYPAGSGRVQVWFTVRGTGVMDELGMMTIHLYESRDNSNWTWLRSYSHENFPSMMGYDEWIHEGYVQYQGIGGRYYKAYVCVWGGKNGAGDSRYFWTDSQQVI